MDLGLNSERTFRERQTLQSFLESSGEGMILFGEDSFSQHPQQFPSTKFLESSDLAGNFAAQHPLLICSLSLFNWAWLLACKSFEWWAGALVHHPVHHSFTWVIWFPRNLCNPLLAGSRGLLQGCSEPGNLSRSPSPGSCQRVPGVCNEEQKENKESVLVQGLLGWQLPSCGASVCQGAREMRAGHWTGCVCTALQESPTRETCGMWMSRKGLCSTCEEQHTWDFREHPGKVGWGSWEALAFQAAVLCVPSAKPMPGLCFTGNQAARVTGERLQSWDTSALYLTQ